MQVTSGPAGVRRSHTGEEDRFFFFEVTLELREPLSVPRS